MPEEATCKLNVATLADSRKGTLRYNGPISSRLTMVYVVNTSPIFSALDADMLGPTLQLGPRVQNFLYDRIFKFLAGRQSRAIEVAESIVVGSITGSVRSRNEDVALVARASRPSLKEDFTLAVLCDGMGGMADGRRAALLAASAFVADTIQSDQGAPPDRLRSALDTAHRAVLDELHGEGGTTLSAVYLDRSSDAWIIHVGDSRVYALASELPMRQLTRDDTIGAALNRENEKRPDFGRLIQFVGIDDDLEPQLRRVERGIAEAFLVTSDGAHGAPQDVLSTVVRNAKSGSELVRRLINLSDALGGLDNTSAIYIPTDLYAPSLVTLPNTDDREQFITLVSVCGSQDLWIIPKEPRSVKEPAGSSAIEKATPDKRPKRSTKKAPRKKSRIDSPEEPPLDLNEPVARLDFPDDGENKS